MEHIHKPLTASGGVGPYTWTIVSGTLPSGLSLSSSGSNTALVVVLHTCWYFYI
ncbi:MAG: hypothetical protein IPJ43_16670 [Saprospiraceae bacterium]|nr:hypothetical protein [Saprospiraceae bacterium]